MGLKVALLASVLLGSTPRSANGEQIQEFSTSVFTVESVRNGGFHFHEVGVRPASVAVGWSAEHVAVVGRAAVGLFTARVGDKREPIVSLSVAPELQLTWSGHLLGVGTASYSVGGAPGVASDSIQFDRGVAASVYAGTRLWPQGQGSWLIVFAFERVYFAPFQQLRTSSLALVWRG